MFLPLLLSLIQRKFLCTHLNFLPLIMSWSEIILLVENKTYFCAVFKMSWYEIKKKVRGARNKKIDAHRNRLFLVATMSCACLLMNTAATVLMSVVLKDWSVSSDKWLTCTVGETSLTRSWANYGMHEGDRYFLFWSWPKDTCWLLFWLLLLHPWYQPSRV